MDTRIDTTPTGGTAAMPLLPQPFPARLPQLAAAIIAAPIVLAATAVLAAGRIVRTLRLPVPRHTAGASAWVGSSRPDFGLLHLTGQPGLGGLAASEAVFHFDRLRDDVLNRRVA